MLGHSHMHDPPALVGEDHQDEQQAARRGRHHEEIRGYHLPDVIRQERAPRLGRRAPRADHVFRDGRLTDVNAQFQQLAVDPGSAPERVGPRHRPNQRAHIGWHGRSSYPREGRARLARCGRPREEILADYPYLEAEDIAAVLEFAAKQGDHPVLRSA